MCKYKLGLYAQYSKIDGSFTGTTSVKRTNDVYKSNLDSLNYKWELITDDENFIYKTNDFFDIPKKMTDFSLATCDICGSTRINDEFIHISSGDDDDQATQCWDCV